MIEIDSAVRKAVGLRASPRNLAVCELRRRTVDLLIRIVKLQHSREHLTLHLCLAQERRSGLSTREHWRATGSHQNEAGDVIHVAYTSSVLPSL